MVSVTVRQIMDALEVFLSTREARVAHSAYLVLRVF